MSDDATQDLPGGHSFEERVFARFDALDARLDGFDARLQALEDQAEQRARDTKPIWERALAEILELKTGLAEVGQKLANVERKLDVLARDIMQVRADQVHLEGRLERLES
jgi:chromosome segregation ATPase